jgi:hypothetical protein
MKRYLRRFESSLTPIFHCSSAIPVIPPLQFKKVGRFWSVRVGLRYRALAVGVDDGYLWFWIGSHADYDRLVG